MKLARRCEDYTSAHGHDPAVRQMEAAMAAYSARSLFYYPYGMLT
jgi:hypothetical protein